VLVDTFGVISPHAVQYFARGVRNRLGVPLETHFHADFGMGVANTIIAVTEGVETIHTTVAGIGERAGNTPMEETILALLGMYGIETGIKTEKFKAISELVLEKANICQPPNRPVIGDHLFDVESGIIVSWVKNVGQENLLTAFPFRPEFVGQTGPEVVLGKGSGLDSVAIWLDRLGKTADKDQLNELLVAVKAKSLELKRTLTEDEFRAIVDKAI
jgi:isopropylmalate/homocitrate/citramalate synthase